MTCQCTCGKHILVDTSNAVTIPVATAARDPYPVVVFQGTTAAWTPNTREFGAGCAPSLPSNLEIRP